MNITFWGAARQVTGSMYQIKLDNGYNILLDCGLDYENREDFDANNRNFPFLPEEIDLLILTHAHVDHSGNLPNLIRQGYRGQILCSEPTVELTYNLLLDSLNVQRIESSRKNGARKNKKNRFVKKSKSEQAATLYGRADVEKTLEAMVSIGFYQPFQVNEDITVELYEAGHILGAASVRLTIRENGLSKTIGFTGDLGNYGSKLVKDPQPMKDLDYLVCESTYGARLHNSSSSDAESVLLEYVQNTCVKYKGKLVIPAFSVGRTQSIIFTFNQLYVQGKLPGVKIYTDSPLAIRTTRMYAAHTGMLNREAADFYAEHGNLFSFPDLYAIENDNDSRMISLMPEPAVIISAAGMVEGGRIQEHVKNNIGDPYSTVLIAGYCAEGTLGAELLKGRPTVKVSKRMRQVYAKIARTDVFSAHPDREGLLRYFKDVNAAGLKKLFLVHGEYAGMQSLKQHSGLEQIEMPAAGDTYYL